MSVKEVSEIQKDLERIEKKIDAQRLRLYAVTPSRQNQAIWILANSQQEALTLLAEDMGYASVDVLKRSNPLARAIEHTFTRPCVLPRAFDSV
jgi:hypothetical protein